MKPDIHSPLIQVTSESQTQKVDMEKLIKEFGEKAVEEAIKYLTYKKTEKAELPKIEKTGFPILYVFRHGQTTDNADMIFSGWRDVNLTEKGIKQAQELAEKIKDKKIDMLFASDMKRAIDTMKIAISKNQSCINLRIEEDPRLRERSYGDWMGKSKLIKQLENPKDLAESRRGYDSAPPNGESIKNTVDRVTTFIEELVPFMKENKINVAVSCHGNSIRGFRKYFEKLSEEETSTVETPLGQDYLAYSIE